MKKLLLILVCLLPSFVLFSQDEINVENEFIYNGKHYVPHSLYWLVGTGYGFNFDEKVMEPNLFVDAHFRLLKKHYFGAGILLSRDKILARGYSNLFYTHDYLKHSVTNAHILYGFRKISLRFNKAIFIGPSINWGFDYVSTDAAGNHYVKPFIEPGFYVNAELTYKYFFDLGVGLSAWTSINKSYQAAGLSLHLYFSAALKRTLNKR